MFKHVDDRALQMDIRGMVERPIRRDGLREDQSRALNLIEDPIEFAQNVGRILEGAADLQGMLCVDTPVVPERQLEELKRMLRAAIDRRDWDAAKAISDKLDDETNASVADARELGVAYGAVLEQLRMGLLDLIRIQRSGPTSHQERVDQEIAGLKTKYGMAPAEPAQPESQAAD